MIELMPQFESSAPRQTAARPASGRGEPAQDFRQSLQAHERREPAVEARSHAGQQQQAARRDELGQGEANRGRDDGEASVVDAEQVDVEGRAATKDQVSGDGEDDRASASSEPDVAEALALLLDDARPRTASPLRDGGDVKPGERIAIMDTGEKMADALVLATEKADAKAGDADKAAQLHGARVTLASAMAPNAMPTQVHAEPGATPAGQVSAAVANVLAAAGDAAQSQTNQGQSQGQPGTFTFSQPTTTAESDNLNAARLARGLQSAIQHNGGAVTLRLSPPELGTVRIELNVTGSRVAAQLHTQNDAARNMLQQQLAQLRGGLEAQGLQVERLSVHSQAGSNQTQAQAEQSPHDGRSRGEHHGQGSSRREQSNQDKSSPNEHFDELLDEMG